MKITAKKGTAKHSKTTSHNSMLNHSSTVDVCLPDNLEKGADIFIDAAADFGVSSS